MTTKPFFSSGVLDTLIKNNNEWIKLNEKLRLGVLYRLKKRIDKKGNGTNQEKYYVSLLTDYFDSGYTDFLAGDLIGLLELQPLIDDILSYFGVLSSSKIKKINSSGVLKRMFILGNLDVTDDYLFPEFISTFPRLKDKSKNVKSKVSLVISHMDDLSVPPYSADDDEYDTHSVMTTVLRSIRNTNYIRPEAFFLDFQSQLKLPKEKLGVLYENDHPKVTIFPSSEAKGLALYGVDKGEKEAKERELKEENGELDKNKLVNEDQIKKLIEKMIEAKLESYDSQLKELEDAIIKTAKSVSKSIIERDLVRNAKIKGIENSIGKIREKISEFEVSQKIFKSDINERMDHLDQSLMNIKSGLIKDGDNAQPIMESFEWGDDEEEDEDNKNENNKQQDSDLSKKESKENNDGKKEEIVKSPIKETKTIKDSAIKKIKNEIDEPVNDNINLANKGQSDGKKDEKKLKNKQGQKEPDQVEKTEELNTCSKSVTEENKETDQREPTIKKDTLLKKISSFFETSENEKSEEKYQQVTGDNQIIADADPGEQTDNESDKEIIEELIVVTTPKYDGKMHDSIDSYIKSNNLSYNTIYQNLMIENPSDVGYVSVRDALPTISNIKQLEVALTIGYGIANKIPYDEIKHYFESKIKEYTEQDIATLGINDVSKRNTIAGEIPIIVPKN